MKQFGLDANLKALVIAEAIGASLMLALRVPPWWVWVVVGVVLLLIATVTYRGLTAAGWVRKSLRARRVARQPRADLPAAIAIDPEGSWADEVGVRYHGDEIITAVALLGKPHTMTALTGETASYEDVIPIAVARRMMEQYGGLCLNTVDIVSAGRRHGATPSAYTDVYEALLASRPAAAVRASWLILRLDPKQCLAAVEYRGDAAAAAVAATQRIAHEITLQTGQRVRPLNAARLDAATRTLLGGTTLDQITVGWRDIRGPRDFIQVWAVPAANITSDFLGRMWSPRTNLTVTTIRLSRKFSGAVDASAVVRMHTASPMAEAPALELESLPARQLDALMYGVPAGTAQTDPTFAERVPAEQLDELRLPVGSDGQLMGTTSRGFPALMPLSDPAEPTRIVVRADLPLIQQRVLRAVSGGARTVVYTDRPQVWARLASSELMIAAPGGGETMHSPAMVVADLGVSVTRSAAVVMTVVDYSAPDPGPWDVSIRQTAADKMEVAVGDRAPFTLTVGAARSEQQFLTIPLAQPQPQ